MEAAKTSGAPTWTIPTSASARDALLLCDPMYGTWTSSEGPNENKPINCLNWYAAYAFCIYDGGFLPTEAEWELAASGGEERVFPWSMPAGSTTITDADACYGANCNDPVRAGLKAGAGRWGHRDIGGNLWEYVLDYYGAYPTDPCTDCAKLANGTNRVNRGGGLGVSPASLRVAVRGIRTIGARPSDVGFRCARRAL